MDENLLYFTLFHLENSKTIYRLYIRSENVDGLESLRPQTYEHVFAHDQEGIK